MRAGVLFPKVILILLAATLPAHAASRPDIDKFIGKNCLECHDTETKKGGLDLSALKFEPADIQNFSTWVRIHDRVTVGEMPPPKKRTRPAPAELKSFTNSVGNALLEIDRAHIAADGRAAKRRLNRYEYEETLRDLLSLPYLQVKNFLPEDRESHLFNKVGDALDVSHVQMQRYLNAAEFALRAAIAPQVERPEVKTNRIYTMEDRAFFGKINLGPPVRSGFPLVGLEMQNDIIAQKNPQMPHTQDLDKRARESMAFVVSTYEPTEIRFSSFRAPISGRYKLRFSAYSITMAPDYKSVSRAKRSEPVTIYAEVPPQNLRKLGGFDVGPDPTEAELDVYLIKGETIRPDAARLHRSRPPDHKNPDMGVDGGPGVAFQWMEWQGPFFDEWPPASHKLLLGDLPLEQEEIKPAEPGEGERRRFREPLKSYKVSAVSKDPEKDAEKLLRNFMAHAYRAPVAEEDVRRFLKVTAVAREKGMSFTDAMVATYTAVLSSPGFIYFQDNPGRLSDLALAERLSYFLWNSGPDHELRDLAAKGKLHKPAVLRAQTERLLNDPRSRQFVNAFLDYWLELRTISGTAPDEELYPDYQLDDFLAESMIDETQLYFAELLKQNLHITNVVSSDFAMLNERLARLYNIPDVDGCTVRRVSLPKDSVRGGFLTQASVLKVTANGTTTSPVKRGAWIMTRIIGKPPTPPPPGVGAVEPDIRGATTIREQLAKHRAQESCNVCHRQIDPAGFALESFDVMGGWRDRYRSVGGPEKVKGIGHNGNYFHFSLGPAVDSSGELPDGRKFADVRQLKRCLASDPDQLARNLAQQLTIYATGAPIGFADRPVIEKILAENRKNSYGVRDLVLQIVLSELFLNK
jgi:hypothetical protein